MADFLFLCFSFKNHAQARIIIIRARLVDGMTLYQFVRISFCLTGSGGETAVDTEGEGTAAGRNSLTVVEQEALFA